MKKIILMMMLLLLTGCNQNNKTVTTSEYTFNNSYYSVFTPYKSSEAGNYIAAKIYNSYDKDEVETGLMRITLDYFDNNRYYLQAGQYLKREKMINLLSEEQLNKASINKIDDVEIEPIFVSYVVEHNFLNSDGKLNGLAFGIVLNPYQKIKNTNRFIELDEETLKQIGIEKANFLVKYLRKDKDLKGINIVIGLYFQARSDDLYSGSYKYVSFTANDKIDNFKKINQKYHLFPSDELQSIDLKSYTNFNLLTDKVKKINSDIFIIGKGLYVNNKLEKLDIDVNVLYYNKDTLIAIAQSLATSITNYNSEVNVKIKQTDDVKVLIIKKQGENKAEIHFLE